MVLEVAVEWVHPVVVGQFGCLTESGSAILFERYYSVPYPPVVNAAHTNCNIHR